MTEEGEEAAEEKTEHILKEQRKKHETKEGEGAAEEKTELILKSQGKMKHKKTREKEWKRS